MSEEAAHLFVAMARMAQERDDSTTAAQSTLPAKNPKKSKRLNLGHLSCYGKVVDSEEMNP